MVELSIIIPARNEVYLQKTIDDILENIESDTEIIAVLDGYWPEPPVYDNDRVVIVHHTKPIGQRAALNEGARISQAKFIMKCDAHCSFGKGFDRILMEDCQYDWTMVPMMYRLHVFDWICVGCGDATYQGIQPKFCKKCQCKDFAQKMLWERRKGKDPSVSWRFNHEMQFKYWRKHSKNALRSKDELIETMSFIGACFLMHRDRFWDLGGMDEAHGFWGQYGTEVACKSWLSGGKLITSKKTWFAHLFRTGNFKGTGFMGSSFPYELTQNQINRARKYSRDLWLNDKWEGANYPLSWLVDKFKPAPDWHDKP
jgi:glycosyltransferase involved in cell wall biosynthesis